MYVSGIKNVYGSRDGREEEDKQNGRTRIMRQ